ncbi:MAG: spermine synthase [Candidatus Eiseniibacteriota bacterium]|nr:MAG: spermine synthase [Candidatus Eisenbacteria bacterium]
MWQTARVGSAITPYLEYGNSASSRLRFLVAILTMGMSGIVAQILLLRELLITFFGNELSIGVILANWLVLEAAGAFFLGKTIERVRSKLEAFVWLTLLFSASLPAAVYFTRTWRDILGAVPGEGLGFLPMVYSSFVILLPVSLSHGALFTFCCKIFALHSEHDARSIGKVYFYETLGTVAGGIALTSLLARSFHSMQIAGGLALLNASVCAYVLSVPFRELRNVPRRVSWVAALLLSGVCLLFVLGPGWETLDRLSIERQWRPQRVVHYRNSIYGNVAVTEADGQYTFFSDGIPLMATPTPDIAFVEETGHFPMLFHPNPRQVLVISGGAGGLLSEILKHPVERVDYVELDPAMIEAVKAFSAPLTQTELSDPRVRLHHADGRFFLQRSPGRYDVVLVGLSNPQDLQTNRLFTVEFFSLALSRMTEDGILSIGLPGSLTYLSEELRELNACTLNSLRKVYPSVRVIPGDSRNQFLASLSPELLSAGEKELRARLEERRVNVRLLGPEYINYRLDSRWLGWFRESLEGGTEKLNEDFRPLGVFYSLSYWNATFSPATQKVFARLERIELKWVSIVLGSLLGLSLLLHFTGRDLSRLGIPLAIASTGFGGMIFDLTLIFAFQALYGYVFYWLAVLVTAFTVGTAVGSLGMTSAMGRIKDDVSQFLRIEVGIGLFSLALPLILLGLSPHLGSSVAPALQALFLGLSAMSGLLVGIEFPLANKIQLRPSTSGKQSENLSRTAGMLYGSDLLGGWLAGMLGGVVMLPVLGLLNTCLVVAVLKASSVVFIVASRRAGLRAG